MIEDGWAGVGQGGAMVDDHETAPHRDNHRVPLASNDARTMQLPAPIRSWLTTVALPGRRIVAVRALTGGYSNDNVVVTVTDGGEYVLRRYRRPYACAVEAAPDGSARRSRSGGPGGGCRPGGAGGGEAGPPLSVVA